MESVCQLQVALSMHVAWRGRCCCHSGKVLQGQVLEHLTCQMKDLGL